MNMNDLIYKKREGGKLSREEIKYFIDGYVKGEIPDYQASALLMAIFFKKMDKEETFELTDAMRYSGDTIDLSQIRGTKVDKHSTGGVGDKMTLIVAPITAAAGVPIAKMSGRGLGFTGGTVDKLESVPGFKTSLEPEEFLNQVNDIGISVIGQTAHITPADKKLYALRDVTSTVDNFSLIASSIMSKKLAAGSDAIVLDVKCGNGAFMENIEDAITLGKIMTEIGEASGKKTVAVITDMSQPLGRAVGNSIEVIEAIETLKGNGPYDLAELAVEFSGIMIYIGGKASSVEEGRDIAKSALESGEALKKLKEMIMAQGGDGNVIEDYELFKKHDIKKELFSDEEGYVYEIKARNIGLASQHTGAGRATKEDEIDLSAGIYLNKKVGDFAEKGELLATFYGNDEEKVVNALNEAKKAFVISKEKTERPVLIKEIIGMKND